MSVDIYFFIEVKDADGKWHLVKWYSDGEFDKDDPTEWDFEKVVDFNGKRMVEKYEFWPGLAWRDELGWARNFESLKAYDLPDDISEELNAMIVEHGEKENENRALLYGEGYEHDYRKKYSAIYLSDMIEHVSSKHEEWKNRLKGCVKDEQLDEINKRIDNLEKIALGKTDKPLKQKKSEKEYEDTLEYYLDEYLFDINSLRMENEDIMEKVRMFTGNRWPKEDNIRVIYYFN